jgi:membrane-associated phospholipid phosphatase
VSSAVAGVLTGSTGATSADPPGGVAAAEGPARGEAAVLVRVQAAIGWAPVVAAARGLSWWGEHAAGWLAIGAIGALADRRPGARRSWLTAAATVAGAHGTSIVVKRVVRRRRPTHPDVRVLVGVPGRFSFPSSHATSTAAAAVAYGAVTGRRFGALAVVPPMLLSRLVLGVHYPSDVLLGSALGAAVAAGVRRRVSGPRRGDGRKERR